MFYPERLKHKYFRRETNKLRKLKLDFENIFLVVCSHQSHKSTEFIEETLESSLTKIVFCSEKNKLRFKSSSFVSVSFMLLLQNLS